MGIAFLAISGYSLRTFRSERLAGKLSFDQQTLPIRSRWTAARSVKPHPARGVCVSFAFFVGLSRSSDREDVGSRNTQPAVAGVIHDERRWSL